MQSSLRRSVHINEVPLRQVEVRFYFQVKDAPRFPFSVLIALYKIYR